MQPASLTLNDLYALIGTKEAALLQLQRQMQELLRENADLKERVATMEGAGKAMGDGK